MTETTNELARALNNLSNGRARGWGINPQRARELGWQIFARKSNGGYEIEANWRTMPTEDDDPESRTGNPFGIGTSYATARRHCATAQEAAEALLAGKSQLERHQSPFAS